MWRDAQEIRHLHLLQIDQLLEQVHPTVEKFLKILYTIQSFSKEPMPTERYDHSCGLVIDRDRGPEVVAAGGNDRGGGGDELSSVDIYTVDANSWRPGDIQVKIRGCS